MFKPRHCNRTRQKCWDRLVRASVSLLAPTTDALGTRSPLPPLDPGFGSYVMGEPDACSIPASWAFMPPVTEAGA
jgi:hypothetical protein